MTRASREPPIICIPRWAVALFGAMLIVAALVEWCRGDAMSDLRTFPTAKLPAVAVWSHTGFGPNWHIEQVRAGHHVIPAFQFKALPEDYPLETRLDRDGVTQDNLQFLHDSKIPINLRSDNWASMMADKAYRVPPTLENLPLSSNVVSLKNGVYGDEDLADMFAPPELWLARGRMWGKTNLIKQMQVLAPDPAWILLSDNNEACRDSPWRYGVTSKISETGNDIYDWSPNLERLSIRVAEYAKTHSFAEFTREACQLQDAQYLALRAGFAESLTAWQGKPILADAYNVGGFSNVTGPGENYRPDFGHFDGGGGAFYGTFGGQVGYRDFTSVKMCEVYLQAASWLKAESLNLNAFREIFVNHDKGDIFVGKQAGRHEVMTPDRYCAMAQWLLWSFKGSDRPVLLRWWYKNDITPTQRVLTTDTSKALAIQYGEPELVNATVGDYAGAGIRACDTICDHPVLRRFYQEGKPVCTGSTHPLNEVVGYQKMTPRYFPDTPRVYPRPGDPDDGYRLLECDLNTPRSRFVNPPAPNVRGMYNPAAIIKVWGTATELSGDYLVHLWSPCNLDGECRVTIPGVGQYTVGVPQPNAYVVVRGGEVLTLDEYSAAVAKTPFELLAEKHPELQKISKEFGDDVLRIIQAAKQ